MGRVFRGWRCRCMRHRRHPSIAGQGVGLNLSPAAWGVKAQRARAGQWVRSAVVGILFVRFRAMFCGLPAGGRLRIAPPDRRGGRGKGGASRDGALYGRLSLLLLSIAHKGLRTMGRIVPALAALRAGLFSDALTGSQQILRGQPKTPPITDRTPGNLI